VRRSHSHVEWKTPQLAQRTNEVVTGLMRRLRLGLQAAGRRPKLDRSARHKGEMLRRNRCGSASSRGVDTAGRHRAGRPSGSRSAGLHRNPGAARGGGPPKRALKAGAGESAT